MTVSLVYRVQDTEGRGPYRPGLSARWSDPNGPYNPPWWVEIGESIHAARARCNDPTMHYGCGFESLDHMHAWFTARDLRKLDRLGFKMVKIVPDIIIAQTTRQVVFGRREPLSMATGISLVSRLVRDAA